MKNYCNEMTLKTVVAGDTVEHVGNLHILGNVEKQAVIKVSFGTITIDGDVANGVSIKSHGIGFIEQSELEQNGMSGMFNGRSHKREASGLHVKGKVGNSVNIVSDGDVVLEQGAGRDLLVITKNFESKGEIEQGAYINSKENIIAPDVNAFHSLFTEHGNIEVALLKCRGKVEAGADFKCKHEYGSNVISAGGKIEIDEVHRNTHLIAPEVHAKKILDMDYPEKIERNPQWVKDRLWDINHK